MEDEDELVDLDPPPGFHWRRRLNRVNWLQRTADGITMRIRREARRQFEFSLLFAAHARQYLNVAYVCKPTESTGYATPSP